MLAFGQERDEELYKCGECGKACCEECAEKDEVIKELGVR